MAEIIETVKQDGDQALRDYTMLFDKVEVTDFEIGQELIDQAFEEIDPEVLAALKMPKLISNPTTASSWRLVLRIVPLRALSVVS